MMPTDSPPPPTAATPPPEAGTPAQVPPAPPPRTPTLGFFVHVGHVLRGDLNKLSPESVVVHHRMNVGVGYDKRIYTSWWIDSDAGVLVLEGQPGQHVQVPIAQLSIEEMAAIRFLISATTEAPATHGWRAHIVEQLGAIVPVWDLKGNPVDTAETVGLFRKLATIN